MFRYSRSGSVSTCIVCLMLDEKWLLDAETWCAVALWPVLLVAYKVLEQCVHYFDGTIA